MLFFHNNCGTSVSPCCYFSRTTAYLVFHPFAISQDALNKSSFENYSSRARDSLSCWTPDCIGFNLVEAVLCHICRKERPGAVLVFMTGWEDISCLRDQLKAHPLLGDPNRVLLLTCHGSMATSEQVRIFKRLICSGIDCFSEDFLCSLSSALLYYAIGTRLYYFS